MIKKLRGRLRIFFNQCPYCNSDAPKIDDCTVCKGAQASSYPPSDILKAVWWARFLQVIHIESGE